MKIIIAGGRNYVPKRDHINKIYMILKENKCKTVFSGKCNSGADLIGELIGRDPYLNCGVVGFPAAWDKYGKSAGPKRNEIMAKLASKYNGGCILLPGGRGTANMKMNAEKYGLKIWEIK